MICDVQTNHRVCETHTIWGVWVILKVVAYGYKVTDVVWDVKCYVRNVLN